MSVTGRFAPSPTGPLHFGSLVAALASWLDARAAGGRWLLRIDDLDRPRESPGAAQAIIDQLGALGLEWDGPIVKQSARNERYRDALELLRVAGHTYACGCSRREIADASFVQAADGAHVYPGTCRGGLEPGRPARTVRVLTEPAPISFDDRIQGRIAQSVAHAVGDFVLRRADGLYAYQLAVVIDDADQGVTDVVRGTDLLESTARQIHLQRLLHVPTPRYAHIPAAVDRHGHKLSKQTGAPPIDLTHAAVALRRALSFLGQPEIDENRVDAILDAAVRQWRIASVPARLSIAID